MDVSFAAGPPLLPTAPRLSPARILLERHLPAFVRDAHRAVELAEQTARLVEDASIDALTGLPNKRFLGRALSDYAGRYGGEEFVVIIRALGADAFMRRLQIAWVAARPHPITFSAGIAPAMNDPLRALEAADKAMYQAKVAGRDQWKWATDEDYS